MAKSQIRQQVVYVGNEGGSTSLKSSAARAYLTVIARDPEAVRKALRPPSRPQS